jgi:predicted permease
MLSKQTFLIISAVIPSFAIAFAGFWLGRLDRRRELNQKSISNLVYYLLVPALIFSSTHKRAFDPSEFSLLVVSALVMVLLMVPVALLLKRRAGVERNGFILPIIFMNTGNISLPIALLMFGNEGLSKSIIFHLANIFVLYSAGVFLVSGQTDLKQFLKIPALYAMVAGVAVATIQMPEMLGPVIHFTGKLTNILGYGAIPLLIVNLGYSMSDIRLDTLKAGITGGMIRLMGGPLLGFGLVFLWRLIGWTPIDPALDPLVLLGFRTSEAIIILNASMPGPVMAYLLNLKYDNCPEQAAAMVAVGTLGGIITIPLVLHLITTLIMKT